LTHPLSSKAELAKCPSAKECMQHYMGELQRRAAEVGYTPTVTDGDALLKDIELAKDLDDGKITKDAILSSYAWVSSPICPSRNLYHAAHPLTDSLLKKIAEKGDSVTNSVAHYIDEVRRKAAEISHTLCASDEDIFLLELEIAKDADDGKITREEAYSKLHGETTRHLIRLYGRSR